MPTFSPTEFDVVAGFEVATFGADFATVQGLVRAALAGLRERGASHTFACLFRIGDRIAALGCIALDPDKLTFAELQAELPDWSKRGVAWFERNVRVTMSAAAVCNDPLRSRQWALDRMGVPPSWPGPAPAGSTLVAIVDSGLRRPDGSLPEDIGAALPLARCQPVFEVDGDEWVMFPDGVDMSGHGTLLAGTIAAVPGNGLGIASAVPADWGIVLMPIKFFGPAAPPTGWRSRPPGW
jgi:hypothetical protein